MKRIIDYYLLEWKMSRSRQPLLLRGARQIGKTYAARQLGSTYENFVEINLENQLSAHQAFVFDLDPKFMLQVLMKTSGQEIIPGKTLLFIDEIQAVPRAIIALRYFYELMPDLHVIAAGSLLDFAIAQVGVPVGRIQALYMHPVSFLEYLAQSHPLLAQTFLQHNPNKQIEESIHQQSLHLLNRYLAIGGMPAAIQKWIDEQNPIEISITHQSILNFYRQDFNKYARKNELKYVEKIFTSIPSQLGQKFNYNLVEGNYKERELSPTLDLLITAGVVQKVYQTNAQGVPLAAQYDERDFKVIFLDIGLSQAALQLNLEQWLAQPNENFINKGALMEAFVGQEIAAYNDPRINHLLFYWHKENYEYQAEIDYLLQIDRKIVPVEVKSGDGRTLKSMHKFLEVHKNCAYGIKFSTCNYSTTETIHSYPLYAIAQVMKNSTIDIKNAITYLTGEPKIINYHADSFADIESQLFALSPFVQEIFIINFHDTSYESMIEQIIKRLSEIFSQHHPFLHQFHLLQKNVKIVQLIHQGKVIWQTSITSHLSI